MANDFNINDGASAAFEEALKLVGSDRLKQKRAEKEAADREQMMKDQLGNMEANKMANDLIDHMKEVFGEEYVNHLEKSIGEALGIADSIPEGEETEAEYIEYKNDRIALPNHMHINDRGQVVSDGIVSLAGAIDKEDHIIYMTDNAGFELKIPHTYKGMCTFLDKLGVILDKQIECYKDNKCLKIFSLDGSLAYETLSCTKSSNIVEMINDNLHHDAYCVFDYIRYQNAFLTRMYSALIHLLCLHAGGILDSELPYSESYRHKKNQDIVYECMNNIFEKVSYYDSTIDCFEHNIINVIHGLNNLFQAQELSKSFINAINKNSKDDRKQS